MRALLIATTLLLSVPAAAAADDVVIDGRGWGHGVGLSQYGAYGYALREGRDASSSSPTTTRAASYGTAPAARMRVRLKRGRAPKISGATARVAANGRRIGLRDDRALPLPRARRRSRGADRRHHRPHAGPAARRPVTVTGGASTVLHGARRELAQQRRLPRPHGPRARRRRGARRQPRLARALPVRRRAGRDAGELAGRGAQGAGRRRALVRAHAAAGRAASYDVFADVRSQVYGGVFHEIAASTAAVRATRARVVTVGGEVAQTFFFSTSGGRTASNEEGFGGGRRCRTCARSRTRTTTCRRSTRGPRGSRQNEVERKLGVAGDLLELAVASRSPSGRAATVLVRGSEGDQTLSRRDGPDRARPAQHLDRADRGTLELPH